MKTYIADLSTYDWNGTPIAYDYETASEIWSECDELNETLCYHEVKLTATAAGTLALTAEPIETERTFAQRIEAHRLARELERIADEYGFFEIPYHYLMGEPELNEIISVIA